MISYKKIFLENVSQLITFFYYILKISILYLAEYLRAQQLLHAFMRSTPRVELLKQCGRSVATFHNSIFDYGEICGNSYISRVYKKISLSLKKIMEDAKRETEIQRLEKSSETKITTLQEFLFLLQPEELVCFWIVNGRHQRTSTIA